MRFLTVVIVLVSSIANPMVLNTIDQITATVLSGTSVRIDWIDNATNSSGYRIERCTTNCTLVSGSWTLVGINGAGVKSFTDTGLTPGTPYRWRVAEDPFMSASATPTSTTTTTTVTTTTTTGIGTTTTTLASNLVGFIPAIGAASDLVVLGSNVYVSSADFGLAIASTSPFRAVGATKLSFGTAPTSNSIAVSGTIAAVHERTASVRKTRILDVSNPVAPTQVSSIIGLHEGLFILGTKLYVSAVVSGNPGTSHFYSYDISTPSNPVFLTDLLMPSVGPIKCTGTICYVPAGSAGVVVIDVSGTPTIATTFDTPGTAANVSLVISENKMYIADTTSIIVADITTRTAPSTLGSAAIAAIDISAKAGGVAVIVDGTNFKTIDASNAAAPVARFTAQFIASRHVAIDGNFAYIANSDTSTPTKVGLMKYDITSLTAPTLVSILYGAFPGELSLSVNTNTNIAIVSSSNTTVNGAALKVVDVSTSTLPVVRSTYTQANTPPATGNRTYLGTGISGSYAFAFETDPGGSPALTFIILDVSNPSNPTLVKRLTPPASAAAPMKAVGTRMFVPGQSAGVYGVNFSTPSSATVDSVYNTPGNAIGIDIVGNFVYVADTTAFLILDISQPTNPILRGSLAVSCISVSVVNNVAWCTDGLNMRKINVTNPASPAQLVSTSAHPGTRILATSSRVYVAVNFNNHAAVDQGIQVWSWDGSTSTSLPTYVKQIIIPGSPNAGLAFGSSGLIVSGDSAGTLSIINP